MIRIRKNTEMDYKIACESAMPIYGKEFINDDYCAHDMAVFYGTEILGIFRITPVHTGIIHVGAILTDKIRVYTKSLIQIVRLKIQEFFMQGIHRIQVDVRTDYEAGHRLVKALGFIAEGNMKMAGPDKKDYTLYARTN